MRWVRWVRSYPDRIGSLLGAVEQCPRLFFPTKIRSYRAPRVVVLAGQVEEFGIVVTRTTISDYPHITTPHLVLVAPSPQFFSPSSAYLSHIQDIASPGGGSSVGSEWKGRIRYHLRYQFGVYRSWHVPSAFLLLFQYRDSKCLCEYQMYLEKKKKEKIHKKHKTNTLIRIHRPPWVLTTHAHQRLDAAAALVVRVLLLRLMLPK